MSESITPKLNAILNKGLSTEEVDIRRKTYGLNQLPQKKGRSGFSIFFAQFKNPLIYIISIAAIISIILREYTDAIMIGVVILIDTVVGFFQESRAEKTMVALRNLLKPIARVIRNGEVCEIDITQIVPDDIVQLNHGDHVAADGRILESVTLSANEAILTGESEPVFKGLEDSVFMGTSILSGRGLMQVTSTGLNTQLGKIAHSLTEIHDEQTPLQIRLGKFGRLLTYLVIAICIIIFLTGLLKEGVPILEMIEMAVVLAIAAIPEGLLIAVTMILVIGMRVILRRKGLVKKLLAVETLGSVTTICTDKTGTLTEGIMQVVKGDFRNKAMAVYVMSLCNNMADSLEISLWNYICLMQLHVNPEEIVKQFPRTFEIPFTSENKYMMTINRIEAKEVALIKGAADIILDMCILSSDEKLSIINQIEKWAGSGLKILALAYKDQGDLKQIAGYTWLGLVGIEDPIRPSVKDAIALCRRAGVKVKMITGDYRKTAEKVALNLGLVVSKTQILEGKELEALSDDQLQAMIKDIVIFCRVTPHHKLKIVNALQASGHITAMIGDGVNDAPALKKANIGVSVGNGTDVAQETANLILLDNNFATLVNAVEEGRIVFDNIKKVVAYVLSNSFAEILVIFLAFILDWPTPLTVAQILWIHLICDGPSDIALGFERGELGIMDEPPKDLKDPILDRKAGLLIIIISVSSAILCLLVFKHFVALGDITLGRTIVFAVLGVQSLIYIFSYRSLRHPIWKSGNFFKNKWLIGSVLLGFSQIFLAIYVPGLNNLLGVVPLNLYGWSYVFTISFGMMFVVEIVKLVGNLLHLTPMQQIFRSINHAQKSIPEIEHLHNLSVDIMRDKTLIQFHFDIQAETPLEIAHDVATRMEKKIEAEFPKKNRQNLEIISHIEPAQVVSTKIHSHEERQTPEQLRESIEANLRLIPSIKGWDHIKILEEDANLSVAFIVFMEGSKTVEDVHHITDQIEYDLRHALPHIKQCIIHTEPVK